MTDETLSEAAARLALPPSAAMSGFPFIRIDGRDWALRNPAKPAWMNPRFWCGGPPTPRTAPAALAKATCPACGHEFTP